MKKKHIIFGVVILLIVIALILNVFVIKKFIKSYTIVEIENRGYNSSDIKNIEIKHSYINKLLSYNEWRISVEFEKEPNVYFWFSYKDKKIVFEGISSEPMMDKELEIEYSEKYKQGKLLEE